MWSCIIPWFKNSRKVQITQADDIQAHYTSSIKMILVNWRNLNLIQNHLLAHSRTTNSGSVGECITDYDLMPDKSYDSLVGVTISLSIQNISTGCKWYNYKKNEIHSITPSPLLSVQKWTWSVYYYCLCILLHGDIKDCKPRQEFFYSGNSHKNI